MPTAMMNAAFEGKVENMGSRQVLLKSTYVRHAPFRIFAVQIERHSLFCSSPFAALMA
jgi:hypothetical protein